MLSHFVSALHAQHGLSLVVREDPGLRLAKRAAEMGIAGTLRAAGRKLNAAREYREAAAKIFGTAPQALPPDVPVIRTKDVNSDEVRQALQSLQPDLVVVNGCSLIRSRILEGLPLVLNVHAGLSPWYRGSFCTEWALLNQDPFNIGYTIHRISARIDGGDMLTQGRVVPEGGDTPQSIHMKLIRDSTAALNNVIRHLVEGGELSLHPQPAGEGFLYLARHFTLAHRQALAALMRRDGIPKMLEKPARKALPIISWKEL